MAKARQILKRAKAVKNIRTITRTMEMVSRARFNKIYGLVVAARPYARKLTEVVGDIVANSKGEGGDHRLLRPHAKHGKSVLLTLTSDRGLCGSYNSSVLRTAAEERKRLKESGDEILTHLVGKKGASNLKFQKVKVDKFYPNMPFMPDYKTLSDIADEMMTQYMDGQITSFAVASMQFISTSRHKPGISRLLPFEVGDMVSTRPPGPSAAYEFLPSPQAVLDKLLPAAIRLRLYQCFIEAAVTEQMARITAMSSATDNANEMLQSLTVLYNRTRQAQITTELNEIIGGVAGLS